MKDNWVGREMAQSSGSPAHDTAALGLSLFSFSNPLPFKTWIWREEEGRAEEADGPQMLVFFYLCFFPFYLT